MKKVFRVAVRANYRLLSFVLSLGAIAVLLEDGVLAQTRTIPTIQTPAGTTATEQKPPTETTPTIRSTTDTTTKFYPQDIPTKTAQGQDQSKDMTPKCDDAQKKEFAVQTIHLYYLRKASQIVQLLEAIQKDHSTLNCLIIRQRGDAEDEIILYGTQDTRKLAGQIIARIDLPLPSIKMEMWGIQISSNDPEDMSKVMLSVNNDIDNAQQLVRETYSELQNLASTINPDDKFKRLLVDKLEYQSGLQLRGSRSLTDILLLMIAAESPAQDIARIANALTRWMEQEPRYQYYIDYVRNQGKEPFERFFRNRGLELVTIDPAQRIKVWRARACSVSGVAPVQETEAREERKCTIVDNRALRTQVAVLEFALVYGWMVNKPSEFDPNLLQQTAENLNYPLQNAATDLNQDMQDLFLKPTLAKIQRTVSRFKRVSYAQVGKTSVASLSGFPTKISSSTVSAFDVTPPLRLSELLTTANALSEQVGGFVPTTTPEMTLGNIPISKIIGLIAAYGEDRARWLELNSGVSLEITPNLLRNMASAELKIKLTISDPAEGGRVTNSAGTPDGEIPPLSRFKQQEVETNIYVNGLDLFTFSAFANQSTLDGGRGYFPIVGTIWRGVFGDVPVLGTLFSWKKPPQNVYHDSLILTNSAITPTAMGIAILYPTLSAETNQPTLSAEAPHTILWKNANRSVNLE